MTNRPDADLKAVERAWALVSAALATFDDDAARGLSALPGWTRGHVVTHMARSADGDRGCAEHATRGQVGVKYPGGSEARAAGIEAGAPRHASELVADLAVAQRRLMATWQTLPDAAWPALADTPAGMRTIADTVLARRRELLVHLVDLDVGVEPSDLPADYLVADADWIAENRADWSLPTS
ncbi:MAG: maleylpyruvate isomerase N-terminal domain-containing protein [Acidimicrobiia bacterium]